MPNSPGARAWSRPSSLRGGRTDVSSNSADQAGELTGNLNSFDFAVANREFSARSVQKVGVGI
jgi:hypothetical protein